MSMDMRHMTPLHVEGIICPRCGIGTLSPATVSETLRVGDNAVEVTVEANVCGYCAEHWFDPPAQAQLDAAIRRLRDGDVAQFTHIGEVYRAS
ncbi:MAG TPA: YgiT-type zinc finger protein [Ktedonobacterales bacterium]|nr:YgiT-type zinc finger protein [Ktedonobacterales bacterium]